MTPVNTVGASVPDSVTFNFGTVVNAFDNVAAISQVKTPVLILHGRKDQVVPYAAAETLQRGAGGLAVLAPIAGDAYHTVDMRYVAPTVWRAFDEMGRMPSLQRSGSVSATLRK